MPTPTEYARLRALLGDTVSIAFTDEELDDLYVQAAVLYPTDPARLTYAAILGIEWLLANTAKQASFTQGMSSHQIGEVFEQLMRLYDLYHLKLQRTLTMMSPSVRWMPLAKKKIIHDVPGS